MTIRKLPSAQEGQGESGGSSNNKRRRIETHEQACFDSLNTDCMVIIFAFLFKEDYDSLAVCSRSCRDARRNESLDQEPRTYRNYCHYKRFERSPTRYHTVTQRGWNVVFSGNQTRLKIVGVEHGWLVPDEETLAPLEGVTSLDIACNP